MDRGAWWARVHGVTKSRTRLSTRIRSVLQQRPDSCEFFCFFALGFIVLLGSVGLEFSSNSENWGPLFLHIFLLSLPLFLLFGNSTSRYGRPLEVVRAVDVLFISYRLLTLGLTWIVSIAFESTHLVSASVCAVCSFQRAFHHRCRGFHLSTSDSFQASFLPLLTVLLLSSAFRCIQNPVAATGFYLLVYRHPCCHSP